MRFFNFFDRFRASTSDRSPWGDFYFEPVSARSISGMRVSADSAMRLAAVYACVRILSETMASLPLVVYRPRKDGGKDRVTDHWLYQLLGKRPNRYQNPFEWREMLQGHLALRGNAFCQILANSRGEITELIPIHPDRVRMELLSSGDYRYRIRDQAGSEIVLPRGEVWHLRGLSSDGLIGLSPIELSRESLGMALAAQDYGARFFSNDAKPTGGWIEFPGTFKDPEAKRVFRESYQAAQSGSNRGKVLVLENGMKFHEVGVTNKDAQFLELRKFQITDIARLFRVPPHMIADLDRATFSNIEQQSLEFVMHTMTPWAERWEASIEADLLPDGDALEIEFDFANLMRGDAASRSAYYQSGIQNGWLTRNEARISENLNPIAGLDQPLRPLNMVEEDVFHVSFWFIPNQITTSVMWAATGSGVSLLVGYDSVAGAFFLEDQLFNRVVVPYFVNVADRICIGVCQTATERRLFVGKMGGEVQSASKPLAPTSGYSSLKLY